MIVKLCCMTLFVNINIKTFSILPVLLQVAAQLIPPLGGGGVPPPVCSWLHAAWYLCRMHQIHRRCHFLQSPEPGHPQQHSQEGGQSCFCCCSETTAATSIPPWDWSSTGPWVLPSASPPAPSPVPSSTAVASCVILVSFAAAPHQVHQQCEPMSRLTDTLSLFADTHTP